MRRHVVGMGVMVSAVLALAACGSSSGGGSPKSGASGGSGGTVTIRLGNYNATGPYSPVYMANALGFFKAEGVNVQYTNATTPAQDKALIGGSLDFATIDSYEVLEANAAGQGVKMIASMSNLIGSSLYVDSSITSVDQLKGKKIAVGSAGTASYIAAEIILDKYGLSKDVKLTAIAGGGPNVLAALQNKLVQAAQFAPPNTAKAAQNGYKELVNGPKVGVDWVQGGVVTTDKYAKAHPDTVKKVAAALAKTWTFVRDAANKDKVIAAIAKDTGSPTASASVTYDYLINIWSASALPTVADAGMQTAIKYTPEAQDKNLKSTDQYDNSYLMAAAGSK